MSLDPRLSQVEYKLRRAEAEDFELRRLVKLAYQLPDLSPLANPVPCLITLNFTVLDNATSSAIVGATVYLYSSGLILLTSGVTDGSGKVTLTATAADTFSWQVQAANTYIDYSGTVTAACGAVVPVAVRLDAGFCSRRLSQFFTVSESYYGVSIPLTYNIAHSKWEGCTTISYPAGGTSPCTATGNIGLHVSLTNLGVATVLWAGLSIGHTHCPVIGALCSSGTTDFVSYTAGASSCTPYPATVSATCKTSNSGSVGAGSGGYIFPSASTGVVSTLNFTEN